jgi:hypothetical protein
MAICQIYYHRELDEQQWAKLDQDVRATGPVPAEGGHLVVAGRAGGRWCVITVWDSEEARDRFFSERLAPAYERAGLSLENAERTVFDVHTLIAGDLTGTPQPV